MRLLRGEFIEGVMGEVYGGVRLQRGDGSYPRFVLVSLLM